MEDIVTVVFVCIAILIGFYINQLWLSIIFAVVLLALLFTPSAEGKRAAQAGPKVRPVIVKRKYVGPESIYPKEMKIRITSGAYGTGTPWYVKAPKTIGSGIGGAIKNIADWFK